MLQPLYSGEGASGTHLAGGWVCPEVSLVMGVKRKQSNLRLVQSLNTILAELPWLHNVYCIYIKFLWDPTMWGCYPTRKRKEAIKESL
jgi:hypothetical protein